MLNPIVPGSIKSEPLRIPKPALDAKSAFILDAKTGEVLYSKNALLKLPPASTTKVMTAIVALERLPMNQLVYVSRHAYSMPASRAGLSLGKKYFARDLIIATLVSSSNDAAVALAEAVSDNEEDFARLMNEKAREFGMNQTRFVNATGLPVKKKGKTIAVQYSTARDLSRLMWYASRDKRIDEIMGIVETTIVGSDKKKLVIRCHNKMLWKTPNLIKGKTGWTIASRHTFVGTDYSRQKTITFAMLSSQKPWMDIERLARFGFIQAARHSFV